MGGRWNWWLRLRVPSLGTGKGSTERLAQHAAVCQPPAWAGFSSSQSTRTGACECGGPRTSNEASALVADFNLFAALALARTTSDRCAHDCEAGSSPNELLIIISSERVRGERYKLCTQQHDVALAVAALPRLGSLGDAAPLARGMGGRGAALPRIARGPTRVEYGASPPVGVGRGRLLGRAPDRNAGVVGGGPPPAR